MLRFLKKKIRFLEKSGEVIGAPVAGKAVSSHTIRDAVFKKEMLGKGMAIIPASGKVYAPVDGTVSQIFDTKHAFTILSEGGAKILIHIGLDTVKMNGSPFRVCVSVDDKVKKGELIAEFDMDMIRVAGLDNIVPIVIYNSTDYLFVNRLIGKRVKVGEDIMVLVRA